MFLIPIFDLDDTLYPEFSYVRSGFLAVALMLEKHYGWSSEKSYSHMLRTLKFEGRGKVFDNLIKTRGLDNKSIIKKCIITYRHHNPEIKLPKVSLEVIKNLTTLPYLVTDGHKIVQANKIDALNIKSLFKKIYITHQYGIKHSKPSTHCFELIRKREKCKWSDMFYVGDNPGKDFVNLNKLGVHTIRVLTGQYSDTVANPGFDAKYKISSLSQLNIVIKEILNANT